MLGDKESAYLKQSCYTSHLFFVIFDIIAIIVIAILYGIGIEKICDYHVQNMVLSYLIIKSWMVLFRLSCCFWLIIPHDIFAIINYCVPLIWFFVMMTYYIAALVYFFSNDNDCQDKGIVVWVAMLLIVIESFNMIIIMWFFLCFGACMFEFIGTKTK